MNETMTHLVRLAADPDAVEELYAAAMQAVENNPDDPTGLFYMGLAYARGEQHGLALAMYMAANRAREDTATQSNIGSALCRLGRYDDALKWFTNVLAKHPDAAAYANMASVMVETGNHARGYEYAHTAVRMSEENMPVFRATRGFAALFLGRWNDAWADYSQAISGPFRKRVDYGGKDIHTLLDAGEMPQQGKVWYINGEQGIGDEIMYLSMLRRVMDEFKPARVVYDTDRRLSRLFARSFPEIEVHGTRLVPIEQKPWLDAAPDYQMPIGEVCRLTGKSLGANDAAQPFLVVDEDMRAMYDGLMRRNDGLRTSSVRDPNTVRIGLTWRGGSRNTNMGLRTLGAEGLSELCAAMRRRYPGAVFYSLQYDDTVEQDIEDADEEIAHYHYATGKGASYDHTAAFIKNLDLVVGVDTAAHHAAAALDVPTHTLVNVRTSWLHHARLPGGASPWYANATLYHQDVGETWPDTIARVFAGSAPL